jgi:hypothetical protein
MTITRDAEDGNGQEKGGIQHGVTF